MMQGDKWVLSIEGSIDSQTAPLFDEAMKKAVAKNCPIILDFAKVNYVSSAGLRVLLSANNALEDKKSLVLIHVSSDVKEVFEITGFSDLLKVE
jgi:anti-sigma B factor antagonist